MHILFLLSRDVAISHVVEEIKRNSSRWIKTLATHYRAFAWQNGYGVFSVGQLVNTTGCKFVRVGGVNDHVHILFLLSRDVAISHVLLSYSVEYDEAYVFKN